MEISKRDISKDELAKINDDFRKIEAEYDVPQSNRKRLNVTIDEDGEVVGFASGLTHHKWFFLSDLWIHERHRGNGWGEKILKMLEIDAKAHGMTHIYTWTTAYNSNEIFYEKQGYRQCFVLEDYFGVKGGHHICLKKEL